MNKKAVFDRQHALALSKAKQGFLDTFLPDLVKSLGIKKALDLGCGFGYFSGYLKNIGLDVTGIDGRPENIKIAKERNPGLKFICANAELFSSEDFGKFDLTLCLGLLYHLENPFSAIRNIAAVTQKICIAESIICPNDSTVTVLTEECPGQDQGVSYVAQIPSESWLVKVFYNAGFSHVYKKSFLPAHEDFRSSLFKAKKRTVLIASKESLCIPGIFFVSEPKSTNRYIWYRFGISNILENVFLKNMAKKFFKRNKTC